ncbi:beta-1,3-galactosyltransferase 5-like [Mytilus californianus]|uniref:beta-1,3-galactosyltransferase 5-like n=1 Tax=Mytilus californianus TaxID=6549 RepID=UPI002247D6E5|nr:beta-1,3-galactosyltransferase 5-like [Mytilus californianus]
MLKVAREKWIIGRREILRLILVTILLSTFFPLMWYTKQQSFILLKKTSWMIDDIKGGLKNFTLQFETLTTRSRVHNSPVKVKPTEKPYKCDGCFSKQFQFLINNEDICKTKNESIDILIMITSSPQNKLSRNAIRETWLTHTKMNKGHIRYVFLLGESPMTKELENENVQTKDIILGNFKDAYNNLTYKTLMGYQWATKYCKNAQFVMKTDDDMYVHIPGLTRVINENSKVLQSAVGGNCKQSARPIRNSRSKWYASLKSYPQKTYPGFCSGTGYITSLNVVTKVIEISKDVPFFHLEDVYVSLCIKQLGLKLHYIDGFMRTFGLCHNEYNTLVTVHHVSVNTMRRMWETLCAPKKN